MGYRLEWSGHRAIKTFEGFVSGAEFQRSVDEFTQAFQFDACRGLLIDAREVTGHSVGEEDLQHLAVMRIGTDRQNPRVPVAIVASAAAGFLLLARDHPDMAGTGRVFVGQSLTQATRWLDIFSLVAPYDRGRLRP